MACDDNFYDTFPDDFDDFFEDDDDLDDIFKPYGEEEEDELL